MVTTYTHIKDVTNTFKKKIKDVVNSFKDGYNKSKIESIR